MQIKYFCVQGTTITYEFSRKNVKNINIRIRSNGSICVSAPMRTSFNQVERFMQEKSEWILTNREKMFKNACIEFKNYSTEVCLAEFSDISDTFFPIFKEVLKNEKPTLKVRTMKTRWGGCNPSKKTITLNTRLMDVPKSAREYVILHEYVHFVHPNHQKPFHDLMAQLMPDYKQRRALLKCNFSQEEK